jgi:ketosteroid isomerase-like protein
MNRAFGLLMVPAIMLSGIIGCQGTADVDAGKAAISAVLDSYITSIENEDMGLYARIIAHDPAMVNFGTDAVERIVGWDALEKLIREQNAVWSGTTIQASDVTINLLPGGRSAWATSLWHLNTTVAGQVVEVDQVRCTWVLEKRQADWVIVHFHKSIGMTG